MDRDDVRELEKIFLACWREADRVGRERIERLLSGLLANRITLTASEARRITSADVEALVDSLPHDLPSDWLERGRPN